MVLSDSAIGTALPPSTFRWGETDVILYALGVGARPPSELRLLNEACGPDVLPTFALVANWWAVKDLRSALDLGTYAIVHSAQSLELHRPIGAAGELSVQAEVSAVWDKGKHAAVELTSRGADPDGTVFVARSQTMVLGAGDSAATVDPLPNRTPTARRMRYSTTSSGPSRPRSTGSRVTATSCTSTRRRPGSTASTTSSCMGCAR